MFNKDEEVYCVDNEGTSLVVGNKYTVEQPISAVYTHIKGHYNNYYTTRFSRTFNSIEKIIKNQREKIAKINSLIEKNAKEHGILSYRIQKAVDSIKVKINSEFKDISFSYINPLNLDGLIPQCIKYGCAFVEVIKDNNVFQALNLLPVESMYRIETIKGKIVEFQQSKEGADLQAIVQFPIEKATQEQLAQSSAIRFKPEQIVHFRVGEFPQVDYYPAKEQNISLPYYGQSSIYIADNEKPVLKLVPDIGTQITEGIKELKRLALGD